MLHVSCCTFCPPPKNQTFFRKSGWVQQTVVHMGARTRGPAIIRSLSGPISRQMCPRSGFSFWGGFRSGGNIRLYPRPVFVPGNIRQNHHFGKPPFRQPPKKHLFLRYCLSPPLRIFFPDTPHSVISFHVTQSHPWQSHPSRFTAFPFFFSCWPSACSAFSFFSAAFLRRFLCVLQQARVEIRMFHRDSIWIGYMRKLGDDWLCQGCSPLSWSYGIWFFIFGHKDPDPPIRAFLDPCFFPLHFSLVFVGAQTLFICRSFKGQHD